MFDTKASLDRLRAIGLKFNEALSLVELVQKWINCSGEEWTVARIKSMKVDLLRHYAGLDPAKSHSWIRYGPKGPKGPFGVIFRLSQKDMRRAWNAIMVYTGLVFQHREILVTSRQWKKAIGAIRRPKLETEALVDALKVVHLSPLSLRIRIPSETGSPLVDFHPSERRRAPKDLVNVREVEGVIDSLRPLIRRTTWTTQNWDILSGTVRGLENSILPDLEMNQEFERRAGGEPTPEDLRPEMGLVSLIQEAGYKLRFAANPYRVYQMALQPLGRSLFDALRSVPNDYTFDQHAGVEAIQQWLRDGYQAASMDLSNATDNAPLDAQLELLNRYGVSTRWLQFLNSTCRGDWFTRTSRHRPLELIQWTVGSPLGLYPTFAAFALWHHAVVQYCFAILEKPKVGDRYPYAIVGDDVCIMDFEVASTYRSLMESWGVLISEEKTLWSNTTAEFVGRVITPNEVIQGIKWKGRCSDESFIDFARNIGPGALLLMRPRQRRIISYIADLPEPYGLGWNPYGIPLQERLSPILEREWTRDERVRTFESRAARVNRLLLLSSDKSGTPVVGRETDSSYLASDQEADEVTSHFFPGWNLGSVLWSNVHAVAHVSGVPHELIDSYRLMLQRSSHLETRREVPSLVVMERKLRRVLARSRSSI